MESILVLTHADETGSALSRASLEAVTAGIELAARLGAPLAIGIVAATTCNRELPRRIGRTFARHFGRMPFHSRAMQPTQRLARRFAALPMRPSSLSLPVRASRASPPVSLID